MGAGRQSLDDLVEEAYRLFERPAPAEAGVCDCCMDPKSRARFLASPVREIPEHDIRDWYFAAADLDLPIAIMRWALPRVLELLSKGAEVASVGNDFALARLAYAGFPDKWTDAEVDLITRYAAALAETAIREHHRFQRFIMDFGTCMEMLIGGRIDMVPVLEAVDGCPMESLVGALADSDLTSILSRRDVETRHQRDRVLDWYLGDGLFDRLMVLADDLETASDIRQFALDIGEDILQTKDMVAGRT